MTCSETIREDTDYSTAFQGASPRLALLGKNLKSTAFSHRHATLCNADRSPITAKFTCSKESFLSFVFNLF